MAGTTSLPTDGDFPLERYRVTSLPPDFYYISNFISKEEEERILQKVRCFVSEMFKGKVQVYRV